MTVITNSSCAVQPQQQQLEALNELDSLLGQRAQIYLDEVDKTGSVTRLSISHVQNDELPRDFSRSVSQVKEIYFSYCNFTHLPSLNEITNLTSLSFAYCRNLRRLPATAPTQLKSLYLDSCSQFDYASQLPQLQQLRDMILCDEDLEHVPLAIFSLSNLEWLEIYLEKPKRLSDEIGNLRNLKVLKLMCDELDLLPRTIGNLESVEEFLLVSKKMTEIPVEVGRMVGLKKLCLDSCDGDQGCPGLKTIPVEVLKLPVLESIDLYGCYKVSIPTTDIVDHTSTSLVDVFSDVTDGVIETNCSESARITHELLHYMTCINKAGRPLLKQTTSIPLALWSRVLGRCSEDADSLYFFLVQLDSLREVTRTTSSQVLPVAKKRRLHYS